MAEKVSLPKTPTDPVGKSQVTAKGLPTAEEFAKLNAEKQRQDAAAGGLPTAEEFARLAAEKARRDGAGGVDLKGIIDTHNKIMERFPSYAWFLDVDELKSLLIESITKEWSPEVLVSRFQKTEWYTSRSESMRQWDALQATDNATAEQRIANRKAELARIAQEIGLPDAANTDGWRGMAALTLRQGMNAEGMRSAMMKFFKFSPETGGTAQANISDVRALAEQYMVKLTDAEAYSYAEKMMRGGNPDAIRGDMIRIAKSRWPHLSEDIDQGMIPQQHFAQHRNMIAQMTGRTAESVDLLDDPKWMQVLQFVDDQGRTRSRTLDETYKYVRGTEDFGNSRVAQQEGAEFALSMANALGKRR